jgi:hypothetical protein
VHDVDGATEALFGGLVRHCRQRKFAIRNSQLGKPQKIRNAGGMPAAAVEGESVSGG